MLGKGTRAVWDVAELARKAGMSYGMYVATHPPIPAPKPEIVEDGKKIFCKLCDKQFVAKGRGLHAYCSPECISIAHESKWMIESRKQCPKCGKWFDRNPTRAQIYCSDKCRKAAKERRKRAREKEGDKNA